MTLSNLCKFQIKPSKIAIHIWKTFSTFGPKSKTRLTQCEKTTPKSLFLLVYIAPRWDDVRWALNWAGDLSTLHDRFRSQLLLIREYIPAYWKQADTLLIMHNGGLKLVSLFCLKSWYHVFYRVFLLIHIYVFMILTYTYIGVLKADDWLILVNTLVLFPLLYKTQLAIVFINPRLQIDVTLVQIIQFMMHLGVALLLITFEARYHAMLQTLA